MASGNKFYEPWHSKYLGNIYKFLMFSKLMQHIFYILSCKVWVLYFSILPYDATKLLWEHSGAWKCICMSVGGTFTGMKICLVILLALCESNIYCKNVFHYITPGVVTFFFCLSFIQVISVCVTDLFTSGLITTSRYHCSARSDT